MIDEIVKRGDGGPYIANPPTAFAVDDHGFAWAVWPDGTMSMVVSTPLNYDTSSVTLYKPVEAGR